MDPITIAALISAGASILGGFLQSDASKKAAKTQEDSANRALDLQQATIAQARADAAPWLNAGKQALAQFQGELGLSSTGADGKPFVSQFQETPGYQFQVDQGEKGVMNHFAALGMKNSGAALKALTSFRSGLADQEYGNYLGRLSGLAGVGQNQVNETNAQSLTSAGTQGGYITDAGAARASGYAGVGNALSNALSGVGNTLGNWLGKQQSNYSYAGA